MSLGIARGFAAALSGYSQGLDDQMQRDRQAKQDAVAEERLNRERKQWAETDKENAAIDAGRTEALAQISKPIADPNSPQGFKTAMNLDVPQTERQKRQGDEAFQYGKADVYTPAGIPEITQAQQANNISALNMAGRDPKTIAAVRQADLSNRLNMESAGLANYIQNDASPEELKKLTSNIALDDRHTYEPVFDPATGMTRIKRGDSEVNLNRADLGKLVSAQHRLKAGDTSAQDVIDSIYTKRDKLEKDSIGVAHTIAQSDNDAMYKSGIVGARNAAAAVQSAKADTARALAAAKLSGVGGFEAAAKLMKDVSPPNEGTTNAVARNNLSNIYNINPNVPKEQAVLAAQDMAVNGPTAKVSPGLDFNKGAVVMNHINSDGVQTPVRYAQNGFKPTDEHMAGFQQDIDSYIASENQKSPGYGNVLALAAKGDANAKNAIPSLLGSMIEKNLLAQYQSAYPSEYAANEAKAINDAKVAAAKLLPRALESTMKSLSLVTMYGKKQ